LLEGDFLKEQSNNDGCNKYLSFDELDSADYNPINIKLTFYLLLSSLISILLIIDGVSFYEQFIDNASVVLLSAILPEILFTFFTVLKGRNRSESLIHGTIIIICFCMTFGASVSKHINKGAFESRNENLTKVEISELKATHALNTKAIESFQSKGYVGNVRKYTKKNEVIQEKISSLRNDLKSNKAATSIGGVGLFTIFSVLIRVLFSLSNFVINRRIGDMIKES
jgi:hypothetical protein